MKTRNEDFKEIHDELLQDPEIKISKYTAGIIYERGAKHERERMEKGNEIENLSLSDLKLLITECANEMEGWRNEKTRELSNEGEVLNSKLEKLWEVFHKKTEKYLEAIKL